MKGYRHKTTIRVRNFEVDWQGIVHNAVYLQYFETGRFEYLRTAGYELNMFIVNRNSRVVLARNEIDYLLPAIFDDRLDIYTKVAMIGSTSLVFEGVIKHASSKKVIAKNRAVHVWLTPRAGKPRKIPRVFVELIEDFERIRIPRKTQ